MPGDPMRLNSPSSRRIAAGVSGASVLTNQAEVACSCRSVYVKKTNRWPASVSPCSITRRAVGSPLSVSLPVLSLNVTRSRYLPGSVSTAQAVSDGNASRSTRFPGERSAGRTSVPPGVRTTLRILYVPGAVGTVLAASSYGKSSRRARSKLHARADHGADARFRKAAERDQHEDLIRDVVVQPVRHNRHQMCWLGAARRGTNSLPQELVDARLAHWHLGACGWAFGSRCGRDA
eukprot:scaffold61898_cov72-Phaeocystis_antarctica.AAC.3